MFDCYKLLDCQSVLNVKNSNMSIDSWIVSARMLHFIRCHNVAVAFV